MSKKIAHISDISGEHGKAIKIFYEDGTTFKREPTEEEEFFLAHIKWLDTLCEKCDKV